MISDYLFYRFHEQYGKRGEGSNPCFSASLFLSAFYCLVLYNVLMFFRILFPNKIISNTTIGKFIVLMVLFLLQFLISRHYKPKIEELKSKYKDHPANKWFKPWMMVLLYVLLFFFPVLVSIIIKAIF